MTIEVNVPDIGDFHDVPVVTILVKVGDMISVEDSIIELESDKATLEVPSPVAGKVVEIKVAEGDNVSEGSLLMLVESQVTAGAIEAPAPVADPTPSAPEAAAAPATLTAALRPPPSLMPDLAKRMPRRQYAPLHASWKSTFPRLTGRAARVAFCVKTSLPS